MSLTKDDLNSIRLLVREEVEIIVDAKLDAKFAIELRPINERLDRIDGRLETLENDVSSIYTMLSEDHKEFRKLEKRVDKVENHLSLTTNFVA